MTVQTPWGYEVAELPSMIDSTDFSALYPDFSATSDQIDTVLTAVSSAIRDYCGWHVAPALECTYTGDGEGVLLTLPAMGVTAVSSLEIEGEETTDYEWRSTGLLRLTEDEFPDSWRSVVCTYTAGFSAEAVLQVVAQIAANALVGSAGVASESAGGVSISYNKTGDGVSGGVSLLARDKALLAPYRITRSI